MADGWFSDGGALIWGMALPGNGGAPVREDDNTFVSAGVDAAAWGGASS